MSIGDWIREATRRRSEKWDQEFQAMRFASDLPKAYEKAFREGHLEVLKEVYNLG